MMYWYNTVLKVLYRLGFFKLYHPSELIATIKELNTVKFNCCILTL